jgi:hypothetical protein
LLLGQLIGVAMLVQVATTVVALRTVVLVDCCVGEEDETIVFNEDLVKVDEANGADEVDETIASEELDNAPGREEEEDEAARLEENCPELVESND